MTDLKQNTEKQGKFKEKLQGRPSLLSGKTEEPAAADCIPWLL